MYFDIHEMELINKAIAQYPEKQAAILDVLHIVQDKERYISEEASIAVAELLGLPRKDLAGAILSACSAAAVQYAVYGEVNVKVVAMATAIGAVSASTGCLQILYTAIVRDLGKLYS